MWKQKGGSGESKGDLEVLPLPWLAAGADTFPLWPRLAGVAFLGPG